MTQHDSSWRRPSLVNATNEAGRSADEEDEAPVLDPEYGDLLDAQWLQRGSDALDPEDDLVDIGLTIDMSDADDLDEAQVTELDVGVLLTSLPAQELSDAEEPAERVAPEGGLGALSELLLPEERGSRHREDDDEVGNDDHFPAFDGLSAPRPSGQLDDDAEGPHEG